MTGKVGARRHCQKCELPTAICACAEAKAYDKANPFFEADCALTQPKASQ